MRLRLLLESISESEQRGLFLVQLLAEALNEMGRQLGASTLEFSDHFLELPGSAMSGVQKAVGPKVG